MPPRRGARYRAALVLVCAAAAGCVVVPTAPRTGASDGGTPAQPRTITGVQTGVNLPAATPDGVQLMLKLRRGQPRVDDPATLARLQRVAAAQIVVLREMSGDAFVVRVRPRAGDDIDSVLRRLRADPAVEFAEPDQPVRAQPR